MYNFTKQDIIDSLRNIGLKKGDHIFIHSNIAFFGLLKDATSQEIYYQIFKSAIFEVIGEEGTMINPTFSYSYCNNEVFDLQHTPSTSGIFSEMARKDPKAIRSEDPNFSIVAIGKLAQYFTSDNSHYAFGDNSFWQKFLDKNGIFVNFNLNIGMATFIHFVENKMKVPYRYHKPFNGISLINGRKIKNTYYHFVRDLNNDAHYPDTKRLIQEANNAGIVKIASLGKGKIYATHAHDLYNLLIQKLKQDPAFLIKGDKV
jgi:aminoglycoside 3-N-acetyltransferase